MKRSFFLLVPALFLLAALTQAHAQGKYMTKTGQVSFFSTSPVEDIEAKNQQVAAVLDFSTSQLAFSLPVKAFVFKRTLMQEHFNENYMESDKFPKATFSGRFVAFDAATLATAGPHNVQVEGDLTLHGVKRPIQVPATVELKDGQLVALATFPVAPADYNIEIPLLVRNSIAKVVSVRVALTCQPVASAVGATTRPTK
ncbi:YceI family protein [Hymenobacter terrenus]|uniref:YceI family protein n=1 Tax=Hymenobacter terrenus TaxID=1629124 RepID=UPI000619581B|nr:YceI family protein [Hymenobacter terrenus]